MRFELGLHARQREHVLAWQQADGHACSRSDGVTDRNGAVLPQFFGCQRAIHTSQWVVGRHDIHEPQLPEALMMNRSTSEDSLLRDADGQVSHAFVQHIHRAGESLVQNPQPGRGCHCQKSITEVHDGVPRHDGVHGNGERRLPARGNATNAIGYGVHFAQQAPALSQQLLARGCRLGLAGAAVKQQHIECFLKLPDTIGQCAWHQSQHPGGCRKAARFRNHTEHIQDIRCQCIGFILHK